MTTPCRSELVRETSRLKHRVATLANKLAPTDLSYFDDNTL